MKSENSKSLRQKKSQDSTSAQKIVIHPPVQKQNATSTTQASIRYITKAQGSQDVVEISQDDPLMILEDSTSTEVENPENNHESLSNIVAMISSFQEKFDKFTQHVDTRFGRVETAIAKLTQDVASIRSVSNGLKSAHVEDDVLLLKPIDLPPLPCPTKSDFIQFEEDYKSKRTFQTYINHLFSIRDAYSYSKFVKFNLKEIILDEAAYHFTWTGSSSKMENENVAIKEYSIINSLIDITFTKFQKVVPKTVIVSEIATFFRDAKSRVKQKNQRLGKDPAIIEMTESQ